MKTICQISFFIGMIAISLTSCKKGVDHKVIAPNSSNQIVRINIAHEPQTLDPRKVRSLNDVNILKIFMEGLTRIDKNGSPTLAMAEKVHISDDLKTYTFTLRKTQWSNGDPVKAQDFEYAWKKSLLPSFNSPNANMLYVIKNAREIKKGNLPLSLLGVDAIDDHTLTITLDHPTPYFLDLVAHPIFFPVNQLLDKTNPNWAEQQNSYITNGPFLMEDWKHHNAIVAVKNKQYWDNKTVRLNQLNMIMVSEDTGFKMFETKELDWDGSPFSMIPSEAIQALRGKHKLETAPVNATAFIRINVDRAPFDSQKMRRAFGLAINRQAIVEHITQGNQIPATGIVPIAMGIQETPYFEDGAIAMAEQLFEEALVEKQITKEDLPEITFLYAANGQASVLAQAIQYQWYEAFGIAVRLEPVEDKVCFDRIGKNNYTLALGSWFADVNDPVNFLEVFKSKTNGINNTNWENISYANLLDISNTCKNKEERSKLLMESEKLIINEMPLIPLYHYNLLYIKDAELKDVVLTSLGNIDFKWAYLNK